MIIELEADPYLAWSYPDQESLWADLYNTGLLLVCTTSDSSSFMAYYRNGVLPLNHGL